MINKQSSNKLRHKRHLRLRKKISGTSNRPRLNVFYSNKNFYVQIIDDTRQLTLCSVHSKEIDSKAVNIESAKKIGRLIAKKALAQGITHIVFDLGGYSYHGRTKALAEEARKEGLKF